MRYLYMAMIMLIGSVAGAALDPAIWPMYLHPSKTDAIESNVVYEVSNRQLAAGIASNLTVKTSWWRSRSGNLQTIKAAIKVQLLSGRWVRINECNGNILGSVLAGNVVPVYSSANVAESLQRWGLPTNYLDYTSWSDLGGVGGFTNDISAVGHPHGVTNSSTARGGTVYPGSRTRWYTSDYGWDGVSVIVTNMTALKFDYDQDFVNNTDNDFWGQCYVDAVSTYPDAIAAVIADWHNANNPFFHGVGQSTFVLIWDSSTRISALALSHSGYTDSAPVLPLACTSFVSKVDFYFDLQAGGLYGATTNLFDGQSYGWTTNRVEATGSVLTNGQLFYSFNVTNPPPNWPAQPPVNTSVQAGWSLSDNVDIPIVVRFEF